MLKNPLWNSGVSNPSGEKQLSLFDVHEFEISVPQCPTHYSPAGNGDVLDIEVHQNNKVSDVTVSTILDSDHLPLIFHILFISKLGNSWNLLKNSLISPKTKINSRVDADKAAHDCAASIASAYRLSTNKITLLDINNDLPGLHC
jgi:hypothetical protein